MAHDVFVSYAAGDKLAADAVCAALERRQIRCWIAPRDARPGLDYADSIVDALDETSVMVFVISSRSIASPHVKREVEHAANKGTNVIPFRIEDVELSRGLRYFLGTVHWIDALTPPIDPQLEYLGDTVQYFLDRKRAATAPGQVSTAASGEPASRSVVPPGSPPSYDAGPPAAKERPSIGESVEASPAAAAPPPAPVAAPAPLRVESPLLRASPTPIATPADPPPSQAAPAASIAPPVSPPARTSVSRDATASAAGTGETITPTRSAAASTHTPAEPIAGPSAQSPPAQSPRVDDFRDPTWLVVGMGGIGAALGPVFASAVLPNIAPGAFMSPGLVVRFVMAGFTTWCWLYGLRDRKVPPALAGGLGGLFIVLLALWTRPLLGWHQPAALIPGTVLKWAAFGTAGGLGLSLGRRWRPTVGAALALACAGFVSVLFYNRDVSLMGRVWLFDLSTTIGWGIGLLVHPAIARVPHQPQISAVAAPGAAPTVEGSPALRPETKNPLWQMAGFGAMGTALGAVAAFGMLPTIIGPDPNTPTGVGVFALITIVLGGVATWGWWYALRKRRSPSTPMGRPGPLVLIAALAVFFVWSLGGSPVSLMASIVLQWVAFGVAGFAASSGRSTRPALSVGIALVCLFLVGMLSFTRYPGRDTYAILLANLLPAIGWGLGLIVCPATAAALRDPRVSSDAAPAGGVAPNPRT